jgi:hypothetical protein
MNASTVEGKGKLHRSRREVNMVPLTALLLPIFLSSVLVFIASSVIHMALPFHKNDYLRVPNEEGMRTALQPLAIPPGDYLVPCPGGPQEMRSPEFQAKVNQGPNIVMTVLPNGPWTMGRNLVLWFIYLLVISLFAGYVTGRALPSGSPYLQVFRFVGTTAFLGYAGALWQMSIWYRRSWATTTKSTIDGLVYAMLTAGVFGWLWPH